LLDQYQGHRGEAVIQLEPGMGSYADLQHRAASASGRYDTAHQFLLDNKIYGGRVGYHLLTPLRLGDSGAAVLVNRGWIPLGAGRDLLPDPRVGELSRQVSGRIKIPADDTFMLGEEELRSGWPYRVQRIDVANMAKELDYMLLPVVLLLDPQQPDGFVRDWNSLPFGPERNVGYAVQWFGLALALMIIYLVVNTRRIE
jgi:surfeit locus 1 family protein